MPWLDLALAGTIVAAAIFGIADRGRHRKLLIGVGAAVCTLLIAVLVWEGLRWQVVALGVAALTVAALSVWAHRRRRPRVARGVLTVGAVGTVLVLAVAAWALPPAFVPAPTGSSSVGVVSAMFTDASRSDRGGEPDGTVRSLPATIWYPAAAAGPGGPLIVDDADVVVDGLAHQYGVPAWAFEQLGRAEGAATPDAPAQDGSYPVVLFSPGLGSSRWLASSWATDVASHGVVVVALDHPYDAAAVTIADGTVAVSELVATGDDEEDNRAAATWTNTRAQDLSALMDALVASDIPELAGANFEQVIVAGHSLGGAAALLASSVDTRMDGVVDIDGLPRSPSTERRIPTVVLVAGDADANPEYDRATDALVAEGATRITVPGVAHLGFTDAALVVAPVPGILGDAAATGPRSAAAATLAVVAAVQQGGTLDPDSLAALGTVG